MLRSSMPRRMTTLKRSPIRVASSTRTFGEAKTHGFEIAVNQKHSDNWTSYINYTWQTGKIDGDKNYDIPRHLLHLGTTFHKDPWTVNVDGMFISDRTEAGMKSGHFKARCVLPLESQYKLPVQQEFLHAVCHRECPRSRIFR